MPHNTSRDPNVLLDFSSSNVWSSDQVVERMMEAGQVQTRRTAERRLHELGFAAAELGADTLRDEHGRLPNRLVLGAAIEEARKRRERVLFVQIHTLPAGELCLHANDSRGARFWLALKAKTSDGVWQALCELQQQIGKPIAVFPHADLVAYLRALPGTQEIRLCPQAYQAVLPEHLSWVGSSGQAGKATGKQPDGKFSGVAPSQHLKRLEAESIHIIREAVAEAQNPVMMYSIGKDSGVMLHLARKAFYPALPPFPLLHIDTRWKFQEMYLFRDFVARASGMELLVHVNPQAIEENINPFDHGSALHTDITKTEGLKQALDHYKFDVVFGGARRDEEKSRAKERVFSFRTASHHWDPKNQRPELWSLYNTRKNPGESIRVFPLSNWTELDIWQYIYQENIPVVPLYFAKPRPVVVRPDMTMMVDDDRCRLLPGEQIEIKKVRFRTLGCYPLTGAVESEAETLEDILLEIIHARQSERQGRKIDTDSAGSMEKKKQEGYF